MCKKIRNVFFKNLTFEKLLAAHYRAKKNKAYKKDVITFEMNLENNIINLLNSIKIIDIKWANTMILKFLSLKKELYILCPIEIESSINGMWKNL